MVPLREAQVAQQQKGGQEVPLEVGMELRACGAVQERSWRLTVGASSLAIGLQVFHGERDQAWGREDQGRLTE